MIDAIDIKIIRAFYGVGENQDFEMAAWGIAKKLYPELVNKKNEEATLRYRIKRLNNLGIFKTLKEGYRTYFILIKDNVDVGKFSFPDRKSDGIAIKVKNKWEVYEL
jgi:hypothetical protein